MRKSGDGVTIRQIAEQAGVAPATVSRALNHHPSISKATVERIIRIANLLGYNGLPKRRIVAALLPENIVPLGFYPTGLFSAVREETAARGWILEAIGRDNLDFLHERLVSGILVLDYEMAAVQLCQEKFRLPMVCVNNTPRNHDAMHEVYCNDEKAIEDAVSYLCGYGHRRIGILYYHGEIARRKKAFLDACRKFDLPTEESRIAVPNRMIGRKSRFITHDAVRQLIDQGITAILMPSEEGGANLLATLREFRLRVPEDISVITWETRAISEYLDPPLTTFEQNFAKMAQAAFTMLEALIGGRPAPPDAAVDYLFHERRSVAPPPAAPRH